MVDRMTEEQAAALLAHIDDLARKLSLADSQAKKNRVLTRWLLFATAVLVGLAVILGAAFDELGDQGETIQDAQVTNCQNANKTREAQRVLWGFVLAASNRDGEPTTPAEERFRREFGAWVNEIFAERDCADLTKQYPLPDPPGIPGAR